MSEQNVLFVSEGDSCVRKYDNSPGICKNVRNCKKAREEYKYGVPLTICAYVSGSPVICCPHDSTSQQSPHISSNFDEGQNRISVKSELSFAIYYRLMLKKN